ncbi:MAG: TipAS antibiotic-recognition domain-containing protein [Frankiales bacterium]|nr:TipAS antibiotic-recognition domain-containing protein [Frankiales bacterium]
MPTAPYAEEARARWGDTDAFRESQRRASRYVAADWDTIRAEARGLEQALADLMHAGVPADAVAAMDLAEEHRRHLSRWFYECAPALHRSLADLYVADERFIAHYDEVALGLAVYVADAIRANAARTGAR